MPTTRATSAHQSRTQALLSTLNTIRKSLGARMLMQKISLENGRYCVSCSQRGIPGGCGRSCALLRPSTWGSRAYACKSDVQARARALRTDYNTYSRVVREVRECEGGEERVSEVLMERWERSVARLRRDGETPTERLERGGWKQVLDMTDGERKGLFKEGWSFEGAWGKGRGRVEEEEVAPDDVVVVLEVEAEGEWKVKKERVRSKVKTEGKKRKAKKVDVEGDEEEWEGERVERKTKKRKTRRT